MSQRKSKRQQGGATMVEFIIAAPVALLLMFGIIQWALMGHVKAQVHYAAFEAARAGAVSASTESAAKKAFQRAMIGYFGGGTTAGELSSSYSEVLMNSSSVKMKTEKVDDKYLKVKVTFGIPDNKQVPIAGKLFVEIIQKFGKPSGDSKSLLSQGLLPVYAEVIVHLHDPAMSSPQWKKTLEEREKNWWAW